MPAVSARTRSAGASRGLVHDFDWEIVPSLEQHPKYGAEILRGLGYPDDIVKGAAEAGLEFEEHIAFVIDSMKPIASRLGLHSESDQG